MSRKLRITIGSLAIIAGAGWLVYRAVCFCLLLFGPSNAADYYIVGITFASNMTGAAAGALITLGILAVRRGIKNGRK